jgi:GH15 family glucan-1,4-alpha-glucosidase
MPVGKAGGGHLPCLVRRVAVVRGSMTFRLEVAPRFGYGRTAHVAERHPHGVVFRSPSLSLSLGTDLPFELRDGDAHASFALGVDQSTALTLERAGEEAQPRARSAEEVSQLFDDTVSYWRSWLSQSHYTGRWREMVHRSALTLKLLTYQPTGAIIAAPTTSLPEQLRGERNWDYRYTWIRDAAFSAYALLRLGFTQEAAAFMQWLTLRFDEGGDHESGPLQVMYGIDGRRELPEERVEEWEGYAASAPVRVGNAAAGQLQLDIYGELIDAVYLYNKYGTPISHDGWDKVSQIVDWVCAHWDQPDEGVWEVRGGRRQFTYSRLMCWVAVERAVRVARQRGLPADSVRWMAVRDAIYRQIMERGWHPQRRAFVQHYDTDVLDASLLLMPLVKFIAPTDPRWLSTLDAISRELVSDSLVYRYNPQAAPDGLRGQEGTFSICTFWYVEALARAGRLDDARLTLEKMFTYANHLGLYAEQIGRTGEQLGNFPQAFTHLALISAAWNLDRALGRRSA